MHTIAIPEARLTLYLPSNLGECDRGQYLDMCELLYNAAQGTIAFNQMKTQAIYKLLDLTPGRKHDGTLYEPTSDNKWDNLQQCAALIASFFTDDNGQKVIVQH